MSAFEGAATAGAGVGAGLLAMDPPVGAAIGLGGVEPVGQGECDLSMSPKKAVHPSEKGVISPDPKRLRSVAAPQGDGV